MLHVFGVQHLVRRDWLPLRRRQRRSEACESQLNIILWLGPPLFGLECTFRAKDVRTDREEVPPFATLRDAEAGSVEDGPIASFQVVKDSGTFSEMISLGRTY